MGGALSSLPVPLGSQRLRKYDNISYSNSGSGNGDHNYNTSGIVISEPGAYIIIQTDSPYTSGGKNYIGMFEIYTDVQNNQTYLSHGPTKYCKGMSSRAGTYSSMIFDPDAYSRKIYSDSADPNNILSTSSGNFLIGMSTYYGGLQTSQLSIIICKIA